MATTRTSRLAIRPLLVVSPMQELRVRRVLMVCRTYPIRVADPAIDGQTSGPMASPVTYEELSRRSGIPVEPLMKIETTTTTRRQRRVAGFDWEQLRRSTFLNGPTD